MDPRIRQGSRKSSPPRTGCSVVVGMRPAQRVARLRRCAELAIAGAPWRAFPGIGLPGAQRIELFTGSRCVLALDSNALRVLVRLGYGDSTAAYASAYRQAQAVATRELPHTIAAMQRAHQLLRRHGRTLCRRNAPTCAACPIRSQCPSAGRPPRCIDGLVHPDSALSPACARAALCPAPPQAARAGCPMGARAQGYSREARRRGA